LDWLFSELNDDTLLLLDSDAEVRNGGIAVWMKRMMASPAAFGAGFTWGPFFLDDAWAVPPGGELLYLERPWLPCVMLRVQPVREALAAGLSFDVKWFPNELAFSRRLARIMAMRWGKPWGIPNRAFSLLPRWMTRPLSRWRLDWLRWSRHTYSGLRPHLAIHDTAGVVYDYLRFEKWLLFAGVPIELSDGEVHHYMGVTRNVVHGDNSLDTKPEDVEEEVVARLKTQYGYDWNG
jgi:hypothetical protein